MLFENRYFVSNIAYFQLSGCKSTLEYYPFLFQYELLIIQYYPNTPQMLWEVQRTKSSGGGRT